MAPEAFTQLLAPIEIRNVAGTLTFAALSNGYHPRPEGRIPPNKLPTVNLSLLFTRYMPARDEIRAGNDHDPHNQSLPCCLDAASLWQWAGEDSRQKGQVADVVREWAKSGVLEWFCNEVATSSVFPDGFLVTTMQRWRQSLQDARFLSVNTTYRLAVGLANPAPMENSGTSWNPTYGIPIIPGASLKGVTRHFLEEELTEGKKPAEINASKALARIDGEWNVLLACCSETEGENVFIADLVGLLFGGTGSDSNEGAIAFFDGWPESRPEDWFEVEVLTSHHQDYYGDKVRGASDKDEPNPVHFLCISKDVRFVLPIGLTRFGRTLDNDAQQQALNLTEKLLEQALRRWGIGAKTGAGYGRMKGDSQNTSGPVSLADIEALRAAWGGG